MEQQTGCKSGKEFMKPVYFHSAYLTYMQSTSCKMLGWMKHKLESRFPGEISITSEYADDTTLMSESEESEEEPLDESERRVKSWLKLAQHSEN